MTPFVIFSLPRSRSAWLSVVLSASGRLVGHDIAIEADTPQDFINDLISRGGTCETGSVFAWRDLKKRLPDVKFAVVLRDPEEVIASLEAHGLPGYSDEIYCRYEQLLELAKEPDVFNCNFNDLSQSDIITKLYYHCTGLVVPEIWVDKLQNMNIQIDLDQRISRLQERHVKINELKRTIIDKVGYHFEVEPWSVQLWNDAQRAANLHFEEVDGGVEPNRKFQIDQNLMQWMQDNGSLLVVTARKDNEFIGYFTWQISLDIESEGLLIAQQGAWYVFPGNPRVAVELFDKSVKELKLRGVKCIFPHHRLQGRGANLGKFFKRKGAKLMQHTYSLWIGEDIA